MNMCSPLWTLCLLFHLSFCQSDSFSFSFVLSLSRSHTDILTNNKVKKTLLYSLLSRCKSCWAPVRSSILFTRHLFVWKSEEQTEEVITSNKKNKYYRTILFSDQTTDTPRWWVARRRVQLGAKSKDLASWSLSISIFHFFYFSLCPCFACLHTFFTPVVHRHFRFSPSPLPSLVQSPCAWKTVRFSILSSWHLLYSPHQSHSLAHPPGCTCRSRTWFALFPYKHTPSFCSFIFLLSLSSCWSSRFLPFTRNCCLPPVMWHINNFYTISGFYKKKVSTSFYRKSF